MKTPTAPANYRDPNKIEDYIQKKTEVLEETVQRSCPLLAEVRGPRISVPSDVYGAWCSKDMGRSEGICWTAVGRDALSILRVLSRKNRALYLSLFHGNINAISPESLFATADERSLLLLDKLYPGLESHEVLKSLISDLHGVEHWVEA